MQAYPALTSQLGNISPPKTEEIAGGAKVRQSMPFFEFGIDIHECSVSIRTVAFRHMPDQCDCRAQFFEPRSLTTGNLQSAVERMSCFAASSDAEENFAAKAMYGGQRLLLAACFCQGNCLVEGRQCPVGIPQLRRKSNS